LRVARQHDFNMLPAFVRIALLARPRQLDDGEPPVLNADRLVETEQANGPIVDDIFRQQRTAFFKAVAPALGGCVLMAAQRNVIGIKSCDLQIQARGKFA